MQDRDDNDAIVSELVEECIGKTAKKNAAKCAMHEAKRQGMPLGQRDCLIDRFKKIVAELG